MAPMAVIIIEALMTNISSAEEKASLAWLLACPFPHPFPCSSNGRTTKVGAAMVVPTNAATIKFPPSPLGMDGINPLAISPGDGKTINMEMRKDIPIIVTKKINTFSKKEYFPMMSRK